MPVVGKRRIETSWEGEVILWSHLLWDHSWPDRQEHFWGTHWAQSIWLGSVRDDKEGEDGPPAWLLSLPTAQKPERSREARLAGGMSHHNAVYSRGANFKLASILSVSTENIHSWSKGIRSEPDPGHPGGPEITELLNNLETQLRTVRVCLPVTKVHRGLLWSEWR